MCICICVILSVSASASVAVCVCVCVCVCPCQGNVRLLQDGRLWFSTKYSGFLVHTHTHARTRARTHAHIHTRTHARTHTHTRSLTRAHVRARAHTHTHAFWRTLRSLTLVPSCTFSIFCREFCFNSMFNPERTRACLSLAASSCPLPTSPLALSLLFRPSAPSALSSFAVCPVFYDGPLQSRGRLRAGWRQKRAGLWSG